MKKSKMIAKSCPKCGLQVAVASKTCKCGHTFFQSRPRVDTPSPTNERRRTARVRRGKPQFYDSQDYLKQKRKSPKKKSSPQCWQEHYQNMMKEKESAARARSRRALRRAQLEAKPRAQTSSRERTPQLRPSQLATCSIILAEINRKMDAVMWRPDF